jgi:hypothetical protein
VLLDHREEVAEQLTLVIVEAGGDLVDRRGIVLGDLLDADPRVAAGVKAGRFRARPGPESLLALG